MPDDDEVVAKTSEKISDRCRTIAFGLLAVTWALWVGDSRASLSLQGTNGKLLVGVAIAAVCALLFDYLQYLFQYREYAVERRAPWKAGTHAMLWLKQIAVAVAAVLFIIVAVDMVSTPALGQGNPTKATRWAGHMWQGSDPSAGKRVVLTISPPDYSGEISAREGSVDCYGKKTGEHVVLVCGSVKLDGIIDTKTKPVSYHGAWSLTTAESTNGGFWYKYDGQITAPVY